MLDSANNRCYNIGVKKKGRAMRQDQGKGRSRSHDQRRWIR